MGKDVTARKSRMGCTLQCGIASLNPSSAIRSELLFEGWILARGPPERVIVDVGPEFRGSFEALCHSYYIEL